MPTRYALDVELKSIVTSDVVSGSNPTARQNSRKEVKKILEDKRAPLCTSGPTHGAHQGQAATVAMRLAPARWRGVPSDHAPRAVHQASPSPALGSESGLPSVPRHAPSHPSHPHPPLVTSNPTDL